MRLLLQFPEGLKQKALEYAKSYEAEGHEVFLSASPCYGACDICIDEARWIRADRIVHFGHNRFVARGFEIPVEYVEYRIDIEIEKLAALLPHLKNFSTIAIATTVQHVHQLEAMKSFFEKHGKRVLIGKGSRAPVAGQVLGCDAGAIKSVEKNAEAIVFVGNGRFHALAIDVEKDKPIFVFDPAGQESGKESGKGAIVIDISKEVEKLRKRRKGAIAKALSCRCFGILLSTKPGQFNPVQAEWAKKELRSRGLEAEILLANCLDPMALNNFVVFDCYVTTACPRMADDTEAFGKPVLSLDMLRELFLLMG